MAILKRYTFTLLEIMIALVILGIIGSITAVQVKKMIDVHRFESEVTALYISLQEAQVLSATYQTDLSLDLQKVGGKLTFQISSDEPFTKVIALSGAMRLDRVEDCKFNEAS